jgi:hypothetical protein
VNPRTYRARTCWPTERMTLKIDVVKQSNETTTPGRAGVSLPSPA